MSSWRAGIAAVILGTGACLAPAQPEFEAVVVWHREGLPLFSEAVYAPDGRRVLINGDADEAPAFDPETFEQRGWFAGGGLVLPTADTVVRILLDGGVIERLQYPSGLVERRLVFGGDIDDAATDRLGHEVVFRFSQEEHAWIDLENQRVRWSAFGPKVRQTSMHPRGEAALLVQEPRGTVVCVDPAGETRWTVKDTAAVSATFDSDGHLVLIGSAEGAQVRDSATGALIEEWPEVRGIASWSLDRSRIAAAHSAKYGEPVVCRVWDLPALTLVEERPVFALGIRRLDWSPDGARLLATGYDSVAFCCGMFPTVRGWQVRNGPVTDLPGQVIADLLEIAQDGLTLMTAGRDTRVNIFDAATGQFRALFSAADMVWSAATSPTQPRFFLGTGYPGSQADNGQISAIDASPAQPAWSSGFLSNGIGSLRVSPDGAIVAAFADGWTTPRGMIFRDAATGERLTEYGPSGWALEWAEPRRVVYITDGTPTVLDVPSGEQVGEWARPRGSIQSLRRSPDGRFIMGRSYDSATERPGVVVWDVLDGSIVTEVELADAAPEAWSPDGRYGAGGAPSGEIVFFEMPGAREVGRMRLPWDLPAWPHVTFFPDGLRLAVQRGDGWLGVVMNPLVCRADCNDDGQIDAADFACFQAAWRARQPIGDFDVDGSYDVRDFAAFYADWARARAGLCPGR